MTTDAKILSALRASSGGVSGAELAGQLGISRAAVWARIEELRSLGYDIEAGPHLGYRLVSAPDALHADDMLARLGKTKVIGRDIRVFEQTTSTNDVVEKLARDGVKEGAVVFAESQTNGRGRLGRKWISPGRKGLWFSILLRPELRPQETTQLTVASATALRRAIQSETGLQPEIKWPNDILIGGRKVAGILTELSAEPDRVRHVILGIGVDVNLARTNCRRNSANRRPRSRLNRAIRWSARRWPRRSCASWMLITRGFARAKFAAVADEWEAHCATIGRDVTIQIGGRKIRGRAESLDADGALLVRTEHGHLERITGGDVALEK